MSYSHGDAFTINGSGYGTRSVDLDIFDDCSGADIEDIWPGVVAGGYGLTYQTVAGAGRSVALPHTHVTQYMAGNASTDSGYGMVFHDVTFSGTKKVFACLYRRHDPNWVFGSSCNATPDTLNDNNHKFFGYSSSGSVLGVPNWYNDCVGNQKCSINSSHTNGLTSVDGLGALSLDSEVTGGSGASDQDPWLATNWPKWEYRFSGASSGATVKFLINNGSIYNSSAENTDDEAGNTRRIWLGSWTRVRNSNCWTFLGDVVLVGGADAWKRVMLANNATYANATITEFQPLTSWANTAIQGTINQGRLPDGNAWLFVFDENDAEIDSVAVTLGAGGFPASTATLMPQIAL